MKKFLIKYRFWFILFSFLYIYLLFILVFPTNFEGIVPYGLNDVSENIEVENDYTSNDDSFFTISVMSYKNVTPLQKMILDSMRFGETRAIKNYYSHLSYDEIHQMGQIEKKSSYQTSTIVAYEMAMEEDTSISINYNFLGAMIHYIPKNTYKDNSDIKIGDMVTSITIDNTPIIAQNLSSPSEYTQFINAFKNEKYDIEIDGQIHNIDLSEDEYSISVYPMFDFVLSPAIALPGLSSSTGGPSGGLLQTLYIYSSLLKLDFSNYKITGTGTMSVDGHVGAIGGIREKLSSALKEKADCFFVPQSNYNELKDLIEEYKDDIDFFVVNDIDDALKDIKSLLDV